MKIKVLEETFTVCKIKDIKEVRFDSPFCFLGKTKEELSLVCSTTDTPANTLAAEDGWRAFQIVGELDFSLVGILSKISNILAQEKIGIFAISTYNTDYILVKEANLTAAKLALEKNGYTMIGEKRKSDV